LQTKKWLLSEFVEILLLAGSSQSVAKSAAEYQPFMFQTVSSST
jgi:hypothetical protein